MNNSRIYHDASTDLWTLIPWGVGKTWSAGSYWLGSNCGGFGGFGGCGGFGGFGGNGGRAVAAFDARGDVARLCLEATGTDAQGRTCRDRYARALWDVIHRFEALDWNELIDTWVSRLTPLMEQSGDRRNYSVEQWLDNVEDVRTYANERAPELREELIEAGYPEP